jgi:cobalamin biosynthesis Mg chelatase CobN
MEDVRKKFDELVEAYSELNIDSKKEELKRKIMELIGELNLLNGKDDLLLSSTLDSGTDDDKYYTDLFMLINSLENEIGKTLNKYNSGQV